MNHQGNISHFSAQKLTVIIEIKVHTIQRLSTLCFDSMNDIFVTKSTYDLGALCLNEPSRQRMQDKKYQF